MSLREKAFAAIAAMVVLYAALAVYWFLSAEKQWKKAARALEREKEKVAREVKLIGEKRKWIDAYEAEKSQLPTFKDGESTESAWIDKLDELAKTHRILISHVQPGREIDAGEVMELPIEVRSWEGSLEALVNFMHALENSGEGMFDIRSLNFKPSSKTGYLRGSFTLTCAYMREN